MLSRPSFVDDRTVTDTVAAHWTLSGVTEVAYLPWGFGAYHWRVADGGGAALFVTLDRLEPRHTAESLEAAYAGAAALAAGGLEAVCAPLRARNGRFTVAVDGGALSVTPWLDGRSPGEEEAGRPDHVARVVDALAALHAAAPPEGLRPWTPRVAPGFADALRARTARPWASGPLAEEARNAIAARAAAIARWTDRYHALADLARSRRDSWVPTHGEPHNDNQLVGAFGLRLVDWESLALAPRERDYADLPAADASMAGPGGADPAMLELFALDWRLSEIDEYARWFSAPHTGTEDDRTALAGLHEELAAE
ncbi:phosphotransferase [Streptomyces huiliensis]|uniref:phosphotransferase n=1 Tax=Streptomyces huiliensis TaxID=2876027 RepID=UPI001CC1181A|nr:phosphotransferase [Streptomyces huiliensis]MBZ4318103.1 phosphotransferase [Streptomyces huiliensis]